MRTANQAGAVSRKLIIWISIPLILAGCVFGWWQITLQKYQRARAAWKTTTLDQLAGLSLTNEDVSRELNTLKDNRGVGEYQEWISERILLMTNDEFLVYASRHGFNNGALDHLFLAHGSNGRWYYSTYHFCNSMVGVRIDGPPGSITEFSSRYAVREFDGKSDVCLEHTWPEKR